MADCKLRRVLFVCGDNHYDAFAQLLESNGFNVQRGAHYDISDEEFHDSVNRPFQFHKRGSLSSARTLSRNPKSNRASCANASVTAQDDSYTLLTHYQQVLP